MCPHRSAAQAREKSLQYKRV